MNRKDYRQLDLPDAETASLFTASKRLIQIHVRKYKNRAAELKGLIQQVLGLQHLGYQSD